MCQDLCVATMLLRKEGEFLDGWNLGPHPIVGWPKHFNHDTEAVRYC